MPILIQPECLDTLLNWAGDAGASIRSAMAEHQDDLDTFKRRLIGENDVFARENPLSIVDDADYNKRAVIVFFTIAVEEAMRRGDIGFEDASDEIFTYFSGQDQAGKTQILGANVQRYYPDMRNAMMKVAEAPREERPFGMR